MSTGDSSFYKGEEGKKYYAEHFGSRLDFGIKYQSRYFAPYCSSALTLLDFGCGDGTILRELPGKTKTGIEINPACVSVIEQQNKDASVPISVVNDISKVPDGSVDVAISNHALEHVPAPIDALSEIKRVLAPSGKLVIVTPFDDWRAPLHDSWTPEDADRHLHTWSPRNLGNLASEAGLSVETVRLVTSKWSPKIFWIHRLFGDRAFQLACYCLAVYKQRREVLMIAAK